MMDTFTFDTADVKYTVYKNVEHLHVLKKILLLECYSDLRLPFSFSVLLY